MKVIRRIIAIILLIQMILISPLSVYFGVENNAYATAAEFSAALESELFKQAIIPILISSGLVFKSKQAIDQTTDNVIEWINSHGFDFKDPDDPDPNKPNLSEILKTMLKGTIIWSAVDQLYKDVIKIPDVIRDLIKHFVDENYDEGENYVLPDGLHPISMLPHFPAYLEIYLEVGESVWIYNTSLERTSRRAYRTTMGTYYQTGTTHIAPNPIRMSKSYNSSGNLRYHFIDEDGEKITSVLNGLYFTKNDYGLSLDESEFDSDIIGIENIVDDPDYDWNNNYTNEKHIPIPIRSDIHGNPMTDDNGYYLPITTEPDIWIDVQPDEIPELNPSGIPQVLPEDLPSVPDDPDEEDDDGKILVFLKNIFNKITGIRNDTATIVEKMPDTSTGSTGGTGGIDTTVPTGFEWGDFRHFLDIFFIFIYFIVILILIILKFLEIVFIGLPTIAANADLLTQYPSILAGVNYVKNLQVGGLSITVHQAFEFVFMIFFYIFIIKQIRKLYKAYVFEESSQNVDYRKDMKMDYYDRNNKPIGWNDTPEQAERRRNIKLKPPNKRFNEDIEWDDWGA